MQKQPQKTEPRSLERLLFACRETGLLQPEILKADLSDPHNGGQSAVLFACEGKKYIFKPRPGEADFAFCDFLEAMAALTDAPLPRAVRPLSSRGADYTIVPFIEGREAENEAEIGRYYQRCGALLALCMVLGATDLHSENLIADGDSPLLVDVETLLSGVTPDQAQREPSFYDALIFSHLLPNWMLDGEENRDVGALTAEGKNLPRLRGEYIPAYAQGDEICRGFEKACLAMIENRKKAEAALQCFAKAPFRKLLRPTDLYARLIGQIEKLSSPEEKRASARRLERAYLRGGEAWAQKMCAICESEISALLRGDIPYFFSLGNSRDLTDVSGACAPDYFTLSPLEGAKRRLSLLSEKTIAVQKRVIRQSLNTVCPHMETPVLSSAMDVFSLLEARAIADNPCAFLGLSLDAKGQACFQSIGFDLYEGLLGVLVFYAALYEATGEKAVLSALKSRYESYRKHYIIKESKIFAQSSNICLTAGLGGHILALGYMARCLQDDAFLSDAARLFSRFSFPDIWEEGGDVFGGAAGLLIALPLLKGRGLDGRLTETARLLSAPLLDFQPVLTGFGHGAAGVALALGAAHFLGAKIPEESILRLLEWEDSLWDAGEQNWPDLRSPEKKGFMKGICSGAPGIALARKQLMQYTDHPEILRICREDIEKALAFFRMQEKPLKRDSLCCGNAALTEAAWALHAEKIPLPNHSPILYHPLETNDFPAGLFQGFAGVGYALTGLLPGRKHGLLNWEVHP